MQRKTASEQLFEHYLDQRGIQYEYEPRLPGPDYHVHHHGTPVWFEVKELTDPRPRPTGSFSPCPAFTRKIKRAQHKFKGLHNDCCAVVLYSNSFYRPTDHTAVLSAAFGEYFQRRPFALDRVIDAPDRFRFFGTAPLNNTTNTRISALLLLQHYHVNELWVNVFHELLARQATGERLPPGASLHALAQHNGDEIRISHSDTIRTVLLENPYARTPFPQSLCTGPFDQRWGLDGNEYTLLQIGAELDALRHRARPVPFTYL